MRLSRQFQISAGILMLLFGGLRDARAQHATTAAAPPPLKLWSFDKDEIGETPAGLLAKETRPGDKLGEWKVGADLTAPSRPNVLALTTNEPDHTFNLALFEATAYQDLDLRVRIRANTGKEDQGGGLLWRCQDENNYYVCRFNPLESNFRVYKVVGSKRSQLQSVELETEAGKWYEIRAVMVGDHITCYLDGKQYLDVQDDTFKKPGKIGLWTKADASSSFDDLAVYQPAAEKRALRRQTTPETAPADKSHEHGGAGH